jgi:hypothetical protein
MHATYRDYSNCARYVKLRAVVTIERSKPQSGLFLGRRVLQDKRHCPSDLRDESCAPTRPSSRLAALAGGRPPPNRCRSGGGFRTARPETASAGKESAAVHAAIRGVSRPRKTDRVRRTRPASRTLAPFGATRRKRPASRFLDPRLASPWGIVVARARDGKTTLAAGAASGSELGREDEERKRDPSHRVSEAPCPATGLSRAPRALRLHGFPYFR